MRALCLLLCGCTRQCAPETLFLDLDLAAAAGADRLEAQVTVGAMPAISASVAYSGRSSGGLELSFASGYPTGQPLAIVVTAFRGETEVAEGSVHTTAQAGCTRVSLSLGGPTSCPHLLCEDFESGEIDPTVWTADRAGVEVDGAHAHSGTQALHSHTAVGGSASIRETLTFPRTPISIRAWFYLPEGTPAKDLSIFRVIQVSGSFPSLGVYVFGNRQLALRNDFPEEPADKPIAAPTATVGEWWCVELTIAGDGTATLWVNDVEHPETRSFIAMPPLGALDVGLLSHDTPPGTLDAWIDDVAVGAAHLGCD